jgi:hypothetical protein
MAWIGVAFDPVFPATDAFGRAITALGAFRRCEFDELFPLSIPRHGGRDLSVGTQRSILDQLEDDVLAWEVRLWADEDDEEAENECGNGEDNGVG